MVPNIYNFLRIALSAWVVFDVLSKKRNLFTAFFWGLAVLGIPHFAVPAYFLSRLFTVNNKPRKRHPVSGPLTLCSKCGHENTATTTQCINCQNTLTTDS